MFKTTARFAAFQTPLRQAGRQLPWFVRVLLGVWAALFMVMALAIGLVGGAALLVWALVRGRKPWAAGLRSTANPFASNHASSSIDVVEGQAREVTPPVPRVDR